MANGLLCAVAALLVWWAPSVAGAASVEVGQVAPDFEAESTHGTIRLSDYRGKRNVILAFYLKDFTAG
jgi:P pilus assembly chaperone PapD